MEHAATLLQEEIQYRLLVNAVTDYAIYMLDPRGVVTSWNAGAQRFKGYQAHEILGQHFSRFYTSEDQEAGLPRLALAKSVGAGKFEGEGWRVRKDGTRFWASVVIDPVRNEAGTLLGFAKVTKDITDWKQNQISLEQAREALFQSQKMEAVGQLTGGIAHDFNNMLAGIAGCLEMLQTRVAQGRVNELERYIIAAQGSARRAASLTHRLLAFARQQTLSPKPVDVNRLMGGMEDLIRSTSGMSVEVETIGAAGLWCTLVDPNQLENALLNLCINARDAMPHGGRLTIETANRWMDDRAARSRDMAAGQYISLCITDTGTGMTPDVMQRAFDPFFTTKPMGEGTGLGLSMIHGFAKQSGGQVRIYSEPGQGSMVCIYLPRHLGEAGADVAAAEIVRNQEIGSGEVVLIVDDEPTVRMLVTDVSSGMGYGTIEAGEGATALRIMQSDVRIDLLVTDIGLPGGMNGRQLADAAHEVRPGLKILFITGYAENAIIGNGILEPGTDILTKPFALDHLASRMKNMITSK